MPWSHTPPMPHEHAKQFTPYWFRAHWLHVVPFAYLPVGHSL